MRQVIINGMCGGIIGYCVPMGWMFVLALVALLVMVANSMTPGD